MTPLDAMREALGEVRHDQRATNVAEQLIAALWRRNILLVELAAEAAPFFIQTRDSGK